MRALRLFESLAAVIARLAALAGAVAGLACFALVCASVVARYFFGTPLPWIDYSAAWLVIALTMLATAETQRRDEHIGVEVLRDRLTGRARHAARILGVLSVVAVAAILLREGIETVAFSRMIGIATEIQAIPLWWLHLLIPIGAALLLLVSLAQLLVLLAGGEPRGPAPKDETGLGTGAAAHE
jgi:TRAP-type C4-dicarboxylate transport system permease small subunit